jgi:hypothetical protein
MYRYALVSESGGEVAETLSQCLLQISKTKIEDLLTGKWTYSLYILDGDDEIAQFEPEVSWRILIDIIEMRTGNQH